MSILIKQTRLVNHFKSFYSNRFSSFFIPKSDYLSDDNFDIDYYCNPSNLNEIAKNIQLRRSDALFDSFTKSTDQSKWLRDNIKILPNQLHSKWKDKNVKLAEKFDKDQFVVEECGKKPDLKFEAKKAEDIFNNFGLLIGAKGIRVLLFLSNSK